MGGGHSAGSIHNEANRLHWGGYHSSVTTGNPSRRGIVWSSTHNNGSDWQRHQQMNHTGLSCHGTLSPQKMHHNSTSGEWKCQWNCDDGYTYMWAMHGAGNTPNSTVHGWDPLNERLN